MCGFFKVFSKILNVLQNWYTGPSIILEEPSSSKSTITMVSRDFRFFWVKIYFNKSWVKPTPSRGIDNFAAQKLGQLRLERQREEVISYNKAPNLTRFGKLNSPTPGQMWAINNIFNCSPSFPNWNIKVLIWFLWNSLTFFGGNYIAIRT